VQCKNPRYYIGLFCVEGNNEISENIQKPFEEAVRAALQPTKPEQTEKKGCCTLL